MKILIQGLCTGLVLQLAVGPVFFFIVNIAFSSNLYAALAAILAVTIVDYLYIGLPLLGIGTLLSSGKGKTVFSAISAIVLILFGCAALKTGITEIIQHTDTAQSVLTPAQSFVRACPIGSPAIG